MNKDESGVSDSLKEAFQYKKEKFRVEIRKKNVQ